MTSVGTALDSLVCISILTFCLDVFLTWTPYRETNLGLSKHADVQRFVASHDIAHGGSFHLPSRKSWDDVSLSHMTPSKIATDKYLKKLIRFLGIPSSLRQQAWLLLVLSEHRSQKLQTETVDDLHENKVLVNFGEKGMPSAIPRPPTFGAAKVSITEHCLKDHPDTLQAVYRVLLLLKESFLKELPMVQLPDVVAFLLHYQTEPEAFYTAYAMADDYNKYFAPPDAGKLDILIKNFIPKLWTRTCNFS